MRGRNEGARGLFWCGRIARLHQKISGRSVRPLNEGARGYCVGGCGCGCSYSVVMFDQVMRGAGV